MLRECLRWSQANCCLRFKECFKNYHLQLRVSVPFVAALVVEAPDHCPIDQITAAVEKKLSQDGFPGIDVDDAPWQVHVEKSEPVSGGKPDVIVSADGQTVQATVVKAR